MNLVKQLKAGKLAQRLRSARSLTSEELGEIQAEFKALGGAAIPPLLDCLSHGEARGPALEALDQLLSDETLELFLEALASKNPTIVSGVTKVLAGSKAYDPSALVHLLGEGRLHRGSLETILIERAEEVAPAQLMAALPEMSKDAMGIVFRILEKTADKSIAPQITSLLTHEDWWVRLNLTRLLGRFKDDPEAVKKLIELLEDKSKGVRLEAVTSLHALRARSAIPALVQVLRDGDLRVQSAAIDALVELGDAEAVPHLLDVLKDESEFARRAAVEVLNEVASTEAVRDLVRALRDEDWWVRVRAADALGSLGGETVVDAVTGLLQEKDDFLRRYAVEILNAIPNQRAVEHLLRALHDDDWWVRERSIDALAKAKDPRAVEPLLELLEEDPQVQVLCVRALGEMGDLRALEPICRLAESESEELRREVGDALGALSKLGLTPEQTTLVKKTMAAFQTKGGDAIPLRVGFQAPFGPESARRAERKERSIIGPRPVADSPAALPGPLPGAEPPRSAPPRSDSRLDPAPPPLASPHTGLASRSLNFLKLPKNVVLLDRYRVLRQIGRGGFGAVYLVEDAAIQEEIILKILNPHMSADETAIPRFVRELKLARRITHANVIRLYDFLDLGVAHAVSMEYFPGRDVGKCLDKKGTFEAKRCLIIVAQVLEGLAAAHDADVIHRDIKPGNVLVDENDSVKIVDFGLAAAQHQVESRLTKSGLLVGTPEYMAPEQISGDEVDGRADLYSVGILMYEMLSGKKPFTAETPVKILFQHLEADAEPLGKVVPNLPLDLEYMTACAMAKNPADRPQSARDMLVMVKSTLAELDHAA